MLEPSTLVAALVLALVPSAICLFVLNAIDRYEKEPWTFLLSSVGLGAIAAPLITLAFLALTGRPTVLPPAFAPGLKVDPLLGIVEELAKGALLYALVHSIRDEFDDVVDGVVYGAALGAGFGAAESFAYAMGGTGLLTGGTIFALVIAGLNQAFYSAVFGAIVGASQSLVRARHLVVVVLALATAAFLHSFHDTFPLVLSRLVGQPDAAVGFFSRLAANAINWLGIATLAVAIALAWRREARILRLELHDEVASGVVSEADFATITSLRRRLARQGALLRAGGLGPVLLLRRRYAAEGELAFHKRRLRLRTNRPPAATRGDELRVRIVELQAAGAEDRR